MNATAALVRYRFGRFELQPEERRLLDSGAPVRIGPHAFDLLVALVEGNGRLVTKDELLDRVWSKVIVEENTLQAHVSALRKILGADAIATVSGRGYRFTPEVVHVDAGTAKPAAEPKGNLPHPLTSFVGREKEIAEVRQLMAGTRLLTLTGAGGCGKTRLALQVAREVAGNHPDGARLVELAPLSDSTLIPQAVAKALDVRQEGTGDLADAIAAWMEPRRLLLVLDNAEHLVASCAELAEQLLRRCAGLAILATSRERLGIVGEATYRVPSLPADEAARLFLDRAQMQRPDLQLTAADASAVATICHSLDGIALAIELAAPRVRSMSITELARRLEDRFLVLTGGSRTALPRHRTLRALIDWSHDLLDITEKAVLRRASVFAGGWTLDAAEHVCAGDGIDPGAVLDLLTSLADKNLLAAEPQGETTRFTMLETVRHYAADRLRESGEEARTRAAHFEYFSGMAARLDETPNDDEAQVWLDRLDRERDNLRGALAWCEADATRVEAGLLLAGRLHPLWTRRSRRAHFVEGRSWVERLLAANPVAHRRHAHAQALHSAGALAFLLGDYAAAECRHRDALGIWTRLGDRRQAARSLGSLGNVALERGDLETARAAYEEALSIAREVGDRRSTALGLHCLGLVAYDQADFDAAARWLEECVETSKDFMSWMAFEVTGLLGRIRHAQGHATGRVLLEESVRGLREVDYQRGLGLTLILLGEVCMDQGDLQGAKEPLREALLILQELGDQWSVVRALQVIGELRASDAPPVALRVWSCVRRISDEAGRPMTRLERARHERSVAATRAAMNDDAAFDRAWAEGRAWTLEEAVAAGMEV
jgi:predicted ATPase/DNA-binding winged helix-turn-helix (wHTH) protein